MSYKTIADIKTDITSNITTGSNATRAADVRSILTDILDSLSIYGALYTVGGATAQSLTDTLAKLTSWAVDGSAANITPDHTDDSLTIPTTGVYEVRAVLHGFGVATTTYTAQIAVNGVADANLLDDYLTTGTERFYLIIAGMVTVSTANHKISVQMKSSNAGGADYTLVNGSLIARKVG